MKRNNSAFWYDKFNYWKINVQKDGIRKTFYSSTPGRIGCRECNEKADAWLDDNVTDSKQKILNLSEKYIEQLKLTTSRSHWAQYESYFNTWIDPAIGNVRIENITEQHFQSIINKAYSKGLSKKTLQNMRGCMLNFLKFCRKCKVTTLFFEDLYIPKGAPTIEKTILQPADINKLFNSDKTMFNGKPDKELYINAYRLEVATGLRPGEVLGLKWTDIKKRIVYLKRSINAYGETTRGKNDNARRSFYLTDLALAVLKSQKDLLSDNNLTSEYIFCDKYGDNIKTQNYNKHWKKYYEYNNIPKTTPYELRHTFVSAVKSLPEGYLKQLVGHSKDMDTYGTYAHEIQGEQKAAAELVQNIFCEIFKTEKNKAEKSQK